MRLQIDPVATAHNRLATAKSELDARTTAVTALGHDVWAGAPFTVTVDAADHALRNPDCRALAVEIGRVGRKAAVGLVLRFPHLPTLADCGGDHELRAYLADGTHIHADIADVDAVLAARLNEIADDATWPVPLRMAAKYAAAGDPDHSIAPASLDDEDVRASLTGNLRWRMTQPASVDMIVDDGVEVTL